MTDSIVRQNEMIRKAQEFSKRNGFESYRIHDGKHTAGDVHNIAGQWAYDGYGHCVEFDNDTGCMTITPSDGHPKLVFRGRKSPAR
ncbi:hypothetical protein [Streptomyces sp. UNOC14_S4]|uniref:hypothetical protein n=1 Tax=Streptomyces sp. UNOC14_S4 TaxID=2872340 RepID=UPI001E4EC77E|nr:hypothetical protein [Streptomyces sp. UNOC14_S4]MCC3766483.1 hypothetical protein [Streptomyces sp. UNOC14_S4]